MSFVQQFEQALSMGQGAAAADIAIAKLKEMHGDAGIAASLGKIVDEQYRDFQVEAVHAFRERIEKSLPLPSVEAIFAPLKDDWEATQNWNLRLDEIAGERLADGFIGRVKANDMPGAEAVAADLIQNVPAEFRAQRARFIGHMLGGLVAEKDRADKLVKSISRNPMKFGLDPMSATDVEEEYARGVAGAAKRDRTSGVSAGKQQLTESIVELSRSLPGRNVIHAVTPEEIQNFERQVRAIVRCCLMSPGHDKFNEATLLFVEFSPKEVSAAGALAGVEQRLYATLGRTARLVASQVLEDLGKHAKVFVPYLAFTQRNLRSKNGRYAVETLGLLKNPSSTMLLINMLNDKNNPARTETVFSLANMGTEAALEPLVKILSQNLKGKVVDGEPRRESFTLISGIGRAVRATKDPATKSKIITQVVKILPKDDMEFPVRAVLNFFTGSQEGIEPTVLNWAAQVAVTAIWSVDRPELARAGKGQALGFRQPLIDLLGRLKPYALPTINETAIRLAKNYSGAYLAIGEFYAKNPDPSGVEVIRQLLFNMALHDDTRKSEYNQQKVFDPETETEVELTKDRVIASLAYALDKINTDEANEVMSDIFQKIKNGQLPQPGVETADVLMRAHEKWEKEGKANLAKRQTANGGSSTGAKEPQTTTPEDLEHIKDLEARYLMAGKRRTKKVAAMLALAQRKILPAVKVIVNHLADKDLMIASAAFSAVQDYAVPPHPQVAKVLANELGEAILSGSNELKVKAGDVLGKIGAGGSPYKEKLDELRGNPDLPIAARAVLDKLSGTTAGAGGSRGGIAIDEEKLGASGKFMPKAGGAQGSDYVSDMDKKRAYMQARQEWIRSGKRGPEPKAPE